MAGLNLYTSNRIEHLADKLADIISHKPLPAMQPEIIAIPSGGMERFVAFSLADKLQICANTRFPFPNSLLHHIFKVILPDISERSVFSPEILNWKIIDHLPGLLDKKEFGPLKQYAANDPTKVKLFQLCRKIADIFDQYTVFRPEMIEAWELGKESGNPEELWQALLWRKIQETISEEHRARHKKRLIHELQVNNTIKNRLPGRIALFGVSFLPQFHLDILCAISQHIDINLFSLNPCRQFWDDIISQKSMAKKSVIQLKKGRDITLLHYETGNRLLSSLGSYGKEFLSMLHNIECNEQSEFFEPEGKSMLSLLQSDILTMHTPTTPHSVTDTDKTIRIHVCHSPLRETEVLHDTILSLFEHDPSLTPNDIVVMIPGIEEYAPYIQTVFDAGSSSAPRIPYTIADMTSRKSSRIINDFFAILDLKKSRFSASAVLSILESDAVRNKAAVSEENVSLIHSWIENTNIRWGIDERDRESGGMPSTSENTWDAGLKRLLLGFAMPSEGDSLFGGILPYDPIEGSDAIIAGKLHLFLENLFNILKQLDTERTLSEWADLLLVMTDTLFAPADGDLHDFQTLRMSITDLYYQKQKSDFNRKIPFTIIRYYLESSLSTKEYGRGYITGGVTFCTMLPMRSVPFKVLCLAGMNDGSFPRVDSSVSFDLIASGARAGDRSLRKEDRYCFLESLLSAREILYISYTGFSVSDNSPIPPSVLVSELIDYIAASFTCGSSHKISAIEHITTHHRLNAFSRHYFSKTPDNAQKLFSYSRENMEAAAAMTTEAAPFIKEPLPLSAEDHWENISIEQLCRFFTHPVKYFLRNRLGIMPPEAQSVISDTEPFSIEGLDKYLLAQKLLEKRVAGSTTAGEFEVARASGLLPHGTAGTCAFNALSGMVDHFASSLNRTDAGQVVNPFTDIELALCGFTIHGRIQTLTENNLLHYRAASIKIKDRLRLWISHLLLNMAHDETMPRTSLLLGMKPDGTMESIGYTPADDAGKHLEQLLMLYREGLTKPLRFYPETSHAFAEAITMGKPKEQALIKAQNAWEGDRRDNDGERDDDFYALFPGTGDPFTGDFAAVAMQVYTPIFLYEHRGAL